MLRLISYLRVSTEDQADYGTGLETQELENALYARRLDAHIIGVESDPGVSGTIYPRPGMERALQRIEAGEADGLLVHRVDRIGRKLHIPPVVFERLQNHGARLLTVQDGEVTEKNILMFSVRCGMAQSDYHQIVANMAAGKRRAAEKGKQPNRSTPPYGYHIVTKMEAGLDQSRAGIYEVIEAQSVVVQTIFRLYASGMSLQALCNHLQEQKIPTARVARSLGVSRWQPATIQRIIDNPVYKGEAVWGKYRHVAKERKRFTPEQQAMFRSDSPHYRKKVLQPESAHVHIAVPPIVDPETWERCQERRKANKQNTDRNDRKHLLSGILFCPTCNRRLVVAPTQHPGQKIFIGYRCRQTSAAPNAAAIVCETKMHNEVTVFAALVEALERIESDPDFAALAYADYVDAPDPADTSAQLAAAQARLKALHHTEEATTTAYIRSIELGTRPELFESKLREISTERERLEKQIADLAVVSVKQRAVASVDIGRIAREVASGLLTALRHEGEEITRAEKNSLLRRMVQSIYPEPGGKYRVTLRPFAEALGAKNPVLVTAIDTAVTRTGTGIRIRGWFEML
jgi:site-specific DNA recombinase